MSRIIGEGDSAMLVAGGLDTSQAVAIRSASRLILLGFYLYGKNNEREVRGFRGNVYDALALLNPEAAQHLRDHQDARATWLRFGADPAMGDEIDAA